MKNCFKALLYILIFSFAGCDKDANIDAKLQGSWELRHMLGIQIAGMSPDFPPENGHIVKFEDDSYQIYDKGKLLLSTTFKIESEQREIDGTVYSEKIVYLDSGYKTSVFFKISGNTLKICYGSIAVDGGTSTYRKK